MLSAYNGNVMMYPFTKDIHNCWLVSPFTLNKTETVLKNTLPSTKSKCHKIITVLYFILYLALVMYHRCLLKLVKCCRFHAR